MPALIKNFLLLFLLIPAIVLAKGPVSITSPDKNINFKLSTDKAGLFYSITYKKFLLADNSRLNISFKQGGIFNNNLTLSPAKTAKLTEDYELITGKASKVHSECNRIILPVTEQSGAKRRLNIEVRVFNDGVAFRYVLPAQNNLQSVDITDEVNTFNFKQDPKVTALILPNYTSSHEGVYTKTTLSKLQADTLMDMPVLFEFTNGIHIAVTEAALHDYAGMYLIKHNNVIETRLSPLPGQPDIKVKAKLPHQSPWRVMMISDRIGALIESNILTNLAEPNKIKDVSWIKPGTTTFPWWNGNVVPDTINAPGNNYVTNMYYVDFCARNNITYHSVVEYGLHEWYVNDGAGFQPGPNADPSRAVPGLDMQQLCDSAAKRGVGIRVWVHFYALYPKLEQTFAQYEKWGIKGLMCDFMDRDDQQMVNMQEEVLACAAKHKLHIQFHGAYKPTGNNRTWPNELTREGTLNYENDKWGNRVTPDNDIDIPFTRLLAGATDYHLGGFRAATPQNFRTQYTRPMVQGTRCHMLGMYVVLESALGMVCDYPDAYTGQPGFEFLKEVPTTWDETRVLDAKASEYIAIARRKGSNWYIGAITNHSSRKLNTTLDFLGDETYMAEIYSDAPDADKDANHLVKEVKQVNKQTTLNMLLAPGGGQVVHLYPLRR
ncbi:glycoside hydrolase family 97 protein [Mucilaginibacter terrigena]|uniref:Glycoside hydrolase family 97 protein n=1 Tax=Mucilaginibacter terrigena TaxID=2492395 RepID=A0A4Q5LP71_9SPHI|nr:glycoside hydrolase family 97 protein [Mucilaginibacter terrigena]RYU91184.1 glycoside hydrolase family 97 protein [Mucilaginibacter terrigena]